MNISLNGTVWIQMPNLDACINVAKTFNSQKFWITDNGAIKEYTMFDGKFREVEEDGKTCEAN
jgi:hypothetical protein